MFKYILIIAVLAMTGTCQDTPWQVVPPEQYDTSPDLISSRNSGLNTILAQLFAEQKVSNTSGWHIIANNSISTYNTTTDIFYMFNLTLDDPAGDLLYTNFTIDVNRTNPNITVITSNSTNVVLNGTAPPTTTPPATTTPAASTTTPTSITTAPAASTATPDASTTTPADNTTTPADNTTAPADNTAAPADNTTAPADNTTAPADNTTTPAANTTAPANTTNTTNTTTPAVSYYCNITLYGKNFTNVNGRSVPTPITRNYQLRNDATQLWFPVAKSVMQELDYFTFAGTNCSFKALLWHTLNFSGGFQSNIIKPPVQSPYYISSDYMDTTLSFKFHYPIPGDPHFATP